MNLDTKWLEVWFADPRVDDLAAATTIVRTKTFDWDKVVSYATKVATTLIPHKITVGDVEETDLYQPFKHGGWDEVVAVINKLRDLDTKVGS